MVRHHPSPAHSALMRSIRVQERSRSDVAISTSSKGSTDVARMACAAPSVNRYFAGGNRGKPAEIRRNDFSRFKIAARVFGYGRMANESVFLFVLSLFFCLFQVGGIKLFSLAREAVKGNRLEYEQMH